MVLPCHSLMIPHVEVIEVPPSRLSKEEITIAKDHGKVRPNTLQVIQNVYCIMEEWLRDGESHKYHHGLPRTMQDEMHPAIKLQIARRRRRRVVLCSLVF
ncbi:hypothetical protein MtrunA17_Chr7g0216521 [Medicago truncatula]|uniref:Uncharacterized protein n=1 Tax=Medicago truncatula TaxID=3880 RepID=A2Q2Q8_MEDTR|nr:hypothetical protein MtrDRAFT_AC151524g9v2 [Medicago truncatula]RHN44173.1 hypothetical protein MtrunA17_Chr7g0216521 [Medicago truncatula]